MDFLHQDVADMPAVDGAVLPGNRAHTDEGKTALFCWWQIGLILLLADMSDLDSNRATAPGFSPVPFDSPFGSSTSSLMVCIIYILERDFADCMAPSLDFPTLSKH